VEGWGKIVTGVVIGVAGTVYATNEDLRKQLPKTARDLPDIVRQRFESAVSAAREASSKRREEILRDLERHDAAHSARVAQPAPEEESGTDAAQPAPVDPIPTTDERKEAPESTEEESR
jgi:cation transport regulator ChaB